MNYRGSYRHLVRNSRAALLAAIELYNKPRIDYREETVVILLLNAWELLMKALVSRQRRSIFYRKRRGQPYRTLSWTDALARAREFFPPGVDALAIEKNLELLATYRDNAIHFYNAPEFKVLIYGLAQTSILNYRDLLSDAFAIDLTRDITWRLLPLGLDTPIDPIAYLRKGPPVARRGDAAVREFLAAMSRAAAEVEAANGDTNRLLTSVVVKLESTKKLEKSDLLVGVQKAGAEGPPLIIERRGDPNITHPLRQKEVVEKLERLHGREFTTYTLQALVWKHGLKADPTYCWVDQRYRYTKYSNDIVAWVKRLTAADLEAALTDYREYQRAQARRKK